MPGGAHDQSMKRIAKGLFNRLARSIGDELQLEFGSSLQSNEAVAQKVLMQQEPSACRVAGGEQSAVVKDVGFRNYSQFEEDGILLYLFSLIPPVNRRCVEICAGNGRECMTANLIINHGWWGYLFDGMDSNVQARDVGFLRTTRTHFSIRQQFTKAWITAENVNERLTAGVTGPVDLLKSRSRRNGLLGVEGHQRDRAARGRL